MRDWLADVNSYLMLQSILFLQNIQSRLFTVGSNLASDPDKEMITPDLWKKIISM
jgi:hypothetical protein